MRPRKFVRAVAIFLV